MELSLDFWGDQGRVGLIRSGPLAGSYVYAYPDTLPEWWTLVVFPSPYHGIDGDYYYQGNDYVASVFDEWDVDWIPAGTAEEAIQRRQFVWPRLIGPVDWLQ